MEETTNVTPPVFVTPRVPILRSSPLSTKREKLKKTPHFLRPAPKVAKTAPPMKSLYANVQARHPRLITNMGTTEPLNSPIYHKEKPLTYFEQCFKIDAIIGKGSFGEVFAVQSLEDSRRYAVKVSIQLIRQNCASKYREVENHMRLPKHSNLVEFVKAWEENGRLYIQQELCEKSLLQHCVEMHALPEKEIWNILIDLLKAVDHLHSNEMIHDDIKPDNIFLTSQSICKLGDFGLVINLRNPKDVDAAEEGDSKYLAPEVLNGSPSRASDIFSLGMTILEAATDLDIPSNGESWHQIRNGQIPDRFFVGISAELRYLIQWMLSSNPSIRPTTRELLSQSCIQKRLLKRKCYVMCVSLYNSLTNWSFVTLTWLLALCWLVIHPLLAAFSAVCNRRSSICALTIGKQHTPIQTPQTSKVFASSLATTPFDYSDDENITFQRRLFPDVPRWQMDEDEEDDEAPTSSSNSSTIESSTTTTSSSSPIRAPPSAQKGQTAIALASSSSSSTMLESPKRRRPIQGWPNKVQSARRILPLASRFDAKNNQNSLLRLAGGDFEASKKKLSSLKNRLEMDSDGEEEEDGGDGVVDAEEEQMKAKEQQQKAAWQTRKYERMMRMEECLDSDDNDAVVTEFRGFVPQSCPPMLRSCRKMMTPRAPKLDFTVLDGDNNDNNGGLAIGTGAVGGGAGAGGSSKKLRSRMIADQDSSADEF